VKALRLKPLLFSWALPLASICAPTAVLAQDLPLDHCDKLPLIQVLVAGHPRWFLIDTAATSMLNLESFALGSARDLRVTSWSGTLATSAKEVTLVNFAVGQTMVAELKLPAIDLSAIGKACGRKIDGILGVDLLAKMGATVDLKRQLLRVSTVDDQREAELVSEMQQDTSRCIEAFNSSDEIAFGGCLDPKIVLFTTQDALYGREKVAGYFRERYFHQTPPASLEIRESAFHAVGQAVWYEYEFTIDSIRGRLHGRGMAMCRKSDGHWRIASMHHSMVESEPAVSLGDSR
jgi:ketosteroid isomerase-like protein